MSRFLNVLRSWLVMVSVIAMGNTVQSFRDHSFLSEKLYTGTPQFVNGLQARTFGIWTLLSSIIRCACAIDIQNRTLYHITLWTFVLALGHFLSEAFIYKTAPLTIGVMAPLIVASFSVIGMLIGFQCFPETQEEVGARQKKRNWIPPESEFSTRHVWTGRSVWLPALKNMRSGCQFISYCEWNFLYTTFIYIWVVFNVL